MGLRALLLLQIVLRHQQYLPDVLAVLDVVVRRGRFIQSKGARDLRPDDAVAPEREQLFAPDTDTVHLAPQVPEIDAEYALVGIDQRERRELKPGRTGERSQHAGYAALPAGDGRREPEHGEAPGRAQQP